MNKTILITALMTLTGALSGAGAGYYAALTLPVAPQAVVLDGEAIGADMLNLNIEDPVAREQLELRLTSVREQAKQLAEQGLIVLDANAVLQAPASAYVKLEGVAK